MPTVKERKVLVVLYPKRLRKQKQVILLFIFQIFISVKVKTVFTVRSQDSHTQQITQKNLEMQNGGPTIISQGLPLILLLIIMDKNWRKMEKNVKLDKKI